MKTWNTRIVIILFATILLLGLQCSEPNGNSETGLSYTVIDKKFILLRNPELIRSSNDAISNHVDSILSGLIDVSFISTGQQKMSLGENLHIAFEIIDLKPFNPQGLPESFDSLAARVIPLSVEILDNSGYGYPDALNQDDIIDDNGNWSSQTLVLGTFAGAGQFNGQGEKYLAFRFQRNGGYQYGYIRLYCSEHNDTLHIVEYAWNRKKNSRIRAGQQN